MKSHYFYQELADQNPELFDGNITHPADQLMAVAWRTVFWNDMSQKLSEIVANGGIVEEAGEQRIINVDPSLPGKINELANKVILLPRWDELEANQLERLQETVVAMKHLIQDANRMISKQIIETLKMRPKDF